MERLGAQVVERVDLDATSWVDLARGFVPPGLAAALYEALAESLPWRQGRVFRYDHWVEDPRLGASWSPGREPPHPLVVDLHRTVRHRWGKPFGGVAFAWYRDGRDAVGFHADRELKWLDDTVIAVLSLGARRPWLLRPKARRPAGEDGVDTGTHDLSPESGDLHVMGGRTQADWLHAVPQRPGLGEGRISLQWRWTSRRGRQEIGGSYRKPRFYSRR